MSDSPSVLVVGCGSIGQRHIRNLKALGIEDVRVFDTRQNLAWNPFGMAACSRALYQGVAVVLVCTPPDSHVEIAHRALMAGAHVFIEKPIADSLEGVNGIIYAATRDHLTLKVGYNLRYDWRLRHVKGLLDSGAIGKLLSIRAEFGSYLPDWRPGSDYRQNYIAQNLLLDATHEIDYVRWLGGEVESVFCKLTRSGTLDVHADTASIILGLESGVPAEIHFDCLRKRYTRRCVLIGSEGELTWDLKGNTVLRNGDGCRVYERMDPPEETYKTEMAFFLRDLDKATVDTGARRVLEIALAAERSAREGREVTV